MVQLRTRRGSKNHEEVGPSHAIAAKLSVLALFLLAISLTILPNNIRAVAQSRQSLSRFLTSSKRSTISSSQSSHVALHKATSLHFLLQKAKKCSLEMAQHQKNETCQYYIGRHNMHQLWVLLREHMPKAKLFVDVGANKGLVSATLLHLWSPQLNVTAKDYAFNVFYAYMKRIGQEDSAKPICGVTDMCSAVTKQHIQNLEKMEGHSLSSSWPNTVQVHSFEPSPPLFVIHDEYMKHNATQYVKNSWKWHRIAVADKNQQVYFNYQNRKNQYDEGAGIAVDSESEPNTRAVTLDTLAYEDKMFGKVSGSFVIDILKIDAEKHDAQVLVGATRLLQQGKIAVITWETPNRFPLHFPQSFGGTVWSFPDLIQRLYEKAGYHCYFPNNHLRMVRLTGQGCADPVFASEFRCVYGCPLGPRGCPVDHSNALCVHPRLVPESLFAKLESLTLTTNSNGTQQGRF